MRRVTILLIMLPFFFCFELMTAEEGQSKVSNGSAQKEVPVDRSPCLDEKAFQKSVDAMQEAFQKTTDNDLWIQILIAGIFALFTFLQLNTEKRHDRTIGRMEKSIDEWKKEGKEFIAERVSLAVEEFLPLRLDLMREELIRYSNEILAPDAHDLLHVRLRRAAQDVRSILSDKVEGKGARIEKIISEALRDWQALRQIFMSERDRLEAGLLAIREKPFMEARDRLRDLRSRHSEDINLVASIDEALNSVRKLLEREREGTER